MKKRVLGVFIRLGDWPNVSGAKWLTGDWQGFARVRTGDWRVIVRPERERIVVARIAHRREVYECGEGSMPKLMTLDNETFVLLPKQEYQDLVARAHGAVLPEYPPADRKGRRPAIAFGVASIARDIITRRLAAGWTQDKLAKTAGVRVETISRIEGAKHSPQQATIERIERALAKAGE